MKRLNKLNWLFAVLLLSGFSLPAFSQGLKEFFNNSEMPLVYLGIDFSKTRVINVPDANSFDIRNRLFGSINDVVVNEPKKYDIASALHKTNVSSNLTAVKAKIEKINAEDILSSNTSDFNRLTETDIAAVVKSLSIEKKSGIGLLFVMEGMKKVDKSGMASVWAVLVDMQTKKVLMCERFENKATGIGFRNYWASTIKETIKDMEGKYKDWKAKYGS